MREAHTLSNVKLQSIFFHFDQLFLLTQNEVIQETFQTLKWLFEHLNKKQKKATTLSIQLLVVHGTAPHSPDALD